MSNGEPHPNAQTQVLSYYFTSGGVFAEILDLSITDTRLAALRRVSDVHTAQAVVWDWTTGQILLVGR